MNINGTATELVSYFLLQQSNFLSKELKMLAKNLKDEYGSIEQKMFILLKDYENNIPLKVKEAIADLLEAASGMRNYLDDISKREPLAVE